MIGKHMISEGTKAVRGTVKFLAAVPPPPAGYQWMWTPMSPLNGAYPVVPGYMYRAVASISGAASGASTSAIADKITAQGFAEVHVWDTPPADWPGPAWTSNGRIIYVEAKRAAAQTNLPASDDTYAGPVLALHYQVPSAFVYMLQPSGTKLPPPPQPPPGGLQTGGGSNAIDPKTAALYLGGAFVLGGAAALVGRWVWTRWRHRL